MTDTDAIVLVGSGPPAEAVTAALADIDRSPSVQAAPDPTAALNIVIDTVGSSVFASANQSLGSPWIAVELGGIGGHVHPDIAVSIAPFSASTSCYRCLHTRVAANIDEADHSSPTTTKQDARLGGAFAGRLATTIISDGPVPETVIELPYAERRLLPVPYCSCADARSFVPRRDHESVSLDETIGRAEHAIDERIGPISEIGEPHSFPLPYYVTALADTGVFSDATAPAHAAGAAIDWNTAFMKALGEALERYAAATYRTASLSTGPPSEHPDSVVPSRFVRPDSTETTDDDTRIQWVPGRNLVSNDPVELPAEFVFFPPPSTQFRPAITTGLGLGTSGTDALLAGLYEVIERDAAMLAWYSTYEPIELSIADSAFTELVDRARSEYLEVTALLVTQDIDVPVITACVHRTDPWPRFAVGASANIAPERAATAALEEALQNWTELRAMGRDSARDEPSSIARYAEFPREAEAFITTDQMVQATALSAPDPPDLPSAELDRLIDLVTAQGLTPYATRLTTRDLDRLGFEAVRVVIPEAQPLFIGDAFYGERARTVPRDLGFAPRLDNPPHPYP